MVNTFSKSENILLVLIELNEYLYFCYI